MRTIETHLTVMPNGRAVANLKVPKDIRRGEYNALVVIDDLAVKEKRRKPIKFSKFGVGLKDEKLTFRREDMYGDDGR